MPSPYYTEYLPILEEAFASGIEPYTETVELRLVKLVTGVELENIKPYLATDKPYRGTFPGASGIFLATDEKTTSAEILANLSFESVPSGSVFLDYTFSGLATFMNKVPTPRFLEFYTSPSGPARRVFAQDFRHYLESTNRIKDTQALVAPSASGRILGHTSDVYVVLPPYSGALRYDGCRPVIV